MSEESTVRPNDIRGASRLVVDGILGLTHLVEALHHNISNVPGVLGTVVPGPTKGITGFTYRSVRWVTARVGDVLDTTLATLVPASRLATVSPRREAILAAINGVLGDHLADSGNPIAIPMCFRQQGRALNIGGPALAAAFDQPSGKLLIFLHGLCMNDLQWGTQMVEPADNTAAVMTAGHSQATLLAYDLGCTALYLHYNSGRHISANGHEFSNLMEQLVTHWPVPVEQVTIIAHSMGGLIARSACHDAEQTKLGWLPYLKSLVFLGTPHQGAPLERGGHWVDVTLGISPYTAPFARLGKIRSAGITDMRYGNLLDADWAGQDRFAHSHKRPDMLPLPKGVRCYAIAATTGKRRGDLGDRVLGDGLVPVDSALGHHDEPQRQLPLPISRQWVAYGMNHFELLSHPAVYERLRRWLIPRGK